MRFTVSYVLLFLATGSVAVCNSRLARCHKYIVNNLLQMPFSLVEHSGKQGLTNCRLPNAETAVVEVFPAHLDNGNDLASDPHQNHQLPRQDGNPTDFITRRPARRYVGDGNGMMDPPVRRSDDPMELITRRPARRADSSG
nr:hypothetical protein CFP56_21779 [Quercus suber]